MALLSITLQDATKREKGQPYCSNHSSKEGEKREPTGAG